MTREDTVHLIRIDYVKAKDYSAGGSQRLHQRKRRRLKQWLNQNDWTPEST